MSTCLPVEEITRAGHFRFVHNRRRFIARRSTLRRLLAGYMEAPPENLVFTYGEHGRPALSATPGLGFNASHSGEIGLLRVARTGRIGVDIEWQRLESDHLAIATRFFSPNEQAQLCSLP